MKLWPRRLRAAPWVEIAFMNRRYRLRTTRPEAINGTPLPVGKISAIRRAALDFERKAEIPIRMRMLEETQNALVRRVLDLERRLAPPHARHDLSRLERELREAFHALPSAEPPEREIERSPRRTALLEEELE